MLIPCPYCGPRDVGEFTYQGDATLARPDPLSTDRDAWNRYVYDRANPAGKHSEYWQHSGGCRALLVVERNTLTHAVGPVRYARDRTVPAKPARDPRPGLKTQPATTARDRKAAPRPGVRKGSGE